MSKIKILIVEDDIIYASKLEIALQELGYIITSTVDNIIDGIKCFYSTNPDIVIIDISLEDKYDGIKLAEKINSDQKNAKPFIYLTASEDNETFLRAKDTSPSAFLLKPFEKKSLEHAIELAFQNFSSDVGFSISNSESDYFIKDNIFIKKDKRIIKIPLSDVLYIKVNAKYSMLFTITGNYVLRISLKEIAQVLTTESLVRVHRNYLVNRNKITEFDLEEDQLCICGDFIPIGKWYKKWITESLIYLK